MTRNLSNLFGRLPGSHALSVVLATASQVPSTVKLMRREGSCLQSSGTPVIYFRSTSPGSANDYRRHAKGDIRLSNFGSSTPNGLRLTGWGMAWEIGTRKTTGSLGLEPGPLRLTCTICKRRVNGAKKDNHVGYCCLPILLYSN